LPPASPGSGSGAAPWTIQVAAFKNRKQAEDMRQHLAASGLEAYVANIAGRDGQARFRVRIGAFKSREEAAAAADRLRGQRSLTTFVTLK
jgi:cell division protein FtsN